MVLKRHFLVDMFRNMSCQFLPFWQVAAGRVDASFGSSRWIGHWIWVPRVGSPWCGRGDAPPGQLESVGIKVNHSTAVRTCNRNQGLRLINRSMYLSESHSLLTLRCCLVQHLPCQATRLWPPGVRCVKLRPCIAFLGSTLFFTVRVDSRMKSLTLSCADVVPHIFRLVSLEREDAGTDMGSGWQRHFIFATR